MQISKYIFGSYLIFFFGTVLTMFILAKSHKGQHKDEHTIVTSEELLPNFSVLVMEDGALANIAFDAKNKIVTSTPEKGAPTILKTTYSLRNDTLFYRDSFKNFGKTIHTDQRPKIIVRDSAVLTLQKNENLDSLNIKLQGGTLRSSNQIQNYKHIELSAKNATYKLSNIKANSGVFLMTKTSGNLHRCRLTLIEANLRETSRLTLSQKGSKNIVADSTSQIRVF